MGLLPLCVIVCVCVSAHVCAQCARVGKQRVCMWRVHLHVRMHEHACPCAHARASCVCMEVHVELWVRLVAHLCVLCSARVLPRECHVHIRLHVCARIVHCRLCACVGTCVQGCAPCRHTRVGSRQRRGKPGRPFSLKAVKTLWFPWRPGQPGAWEALQGRCSLAGSSRPLASGSCAPTPVLGAFSFLGVPSPVWGPLPFLGTLFFSRAPLQEPELLRPALSPLLPLQNKCAPSLLAPPLQPPVLKSRFASPRGR